MPRSRLYTSLSAYTRCVFTMLTNAGISGPMDEFEKSMESQFPSSSVIPVSMARTGIYLVLKYTIKPGQKVILSPYTISDVVNMVLCAGGIPVFADIEKGGSFNIDPDEVKALLEKEENVGAVLVTHFYGLACQIGPILKTCQNYGVPVIEDAAQAFGTQIEGKPAGTIGYAGIFSFGLLKNVTGFLGGLVVTANRELAEKIRRDTATFPPFPKKKVFQKMLKGMVFDFATNPFIFDIFVYWMFRYAYLQNMDFFKNKLDTDSNPRSFDVFPKEYAYKMWLVQAKIVQDQIPNRDTQTLDRIEQAKIYDSGLKDIADLILPPLRTDRSHLYIYYPIQYDRREDLARWMTQKNRDVQISHHRNCASMACFSKYYRNCPNAEKAGKSVSYLPTYPGYGAEQVQQNVEAIQTFFSKAIK